MKREREERVQLVYKMLGFDVAIQKIVEDLLIACRSAYHGKIAENITVEEFKSVCAIVYQLQDENQVSAENLDIVWCRLWWENGTLSYHLRNDNFHPVLIANLLGLVGRERFKVPNFDWSANDPLRCWGGTSMRYNHPLVKYLSPDVSFSNDSISRHSAYRVSNIICEVGCTETLANMIRKAHIHLSGFGNRMVILIKVVRSASEVSRRIPGQMVCVVLNAEDREVTAVPSTQAQQQQHVTQAASYDSGADEIEVPKEPSVPPNVQSVARSVISFGSYLLPETAEYIKELTQVADTNFTGVGRPGRVVACDQPNLPQYQVRLPVADVWYGVPAEAVPADAQDYHFDLFGIIHCVLRH